MKPQVLFGGRVGMTNIQNSFNKRCHEMKLGLQNFTVIMSIEKRAVTNVIATS
jgi:hypothetical protein